VAHPGVDWRLPAIEKKQEEVTREFISAHFTNQKEFERYKAEFDDSEVPGICLTTSEQVEDGQSIYDIHREECARFYALIRKFEPENAVLTGVFNGVLTLGILAALEQNGHGTLRSICCSDESHDEEDTFLNREGPSPAESGSTVLPEGKEPGWIVPKSLEERWHHVTGKSTTRLSSLLDDLETVDMFFHNSEYSQSRMLFEFELAWEHLTPGGVIFSHHAGRNTVHKTFVDERNADSGLIYWRRSDEGVMKSVYIRKRI
jgi:predicted O-methyltransferase YrrM